MGDTCTLVNREENWKPESFGRSTGRKQGVMMSSRLAEFDVVTQLLSETTARVKSAFVCSMGFPAGSDSKESACSAGDPGSVLGSGKCTGEGNGYPLQYSCLENFMDRGAWWASVRGVSKGSDIQLSN